MWVDRTRSGHCGDIISRTHRVSLSTSFFYSVTVTDNNKIHTHTALLACTDIQKFSFADFNDYNFAFQYWFNLIWNKTFPNELARLAVLLVRARLCGMCRALTLLLCFLAVIIPSVPSDLYESFITHILQGSFTGPGAIIQWRNPGKYG